MSNGAVEVKWSTKNKYVVHNFIVRKHENGKVHINSPHVSAVCEEDTFPKLDPLYIVWRIIWYQVLLDKIPKISEGNPNKIQEEIPPKNRKKSKKLFQKWDPVCIVWRIFWYIRYCSQAGAGASYCARASAHSPVLEKAKNLPPNSFVIVDRAVFA